MPIAAVDVVLGTIVKCRVDGDIGAAAAMRVVKERMIGRCHHGGLCSRSQCYLCTRFGFGGPAVFLRFCVLSILRYLFKARSRDLMVPKPQSGGGERR